MTNTLFTRKIISGLILCLAVVALLNSCKKFIDIDAPKNELVSEIVFENDATATSALLGVYSEMMRTRTPMSVLSSLYLGQSADELVSLASPVSRYNSNSLLSLPFYDDDFWSAYYQYIYQANSIIESVEQSKNLSAGARTILTGEAKFLRAFAHFYLVNLFGEIPIITGTNYKTNNLASRQPVEDVYKQIVTDLTAAREALPQQYLDGKNNESIEKVRPNKATVDAFLARVYLYRNNWIEAEAMASLLINNADYQLEENLEEVFLANSNESIWQLMPAATGATNGWEGYYFIITAPPAIFDGSISVKLSQTILNAFEDGDKRQNTWISNFTDGTDTWYYPYKYTVKPLRTPVKEYYTVLRLAEQFLIRAEARAQQNNIEGAVQDINRIRARARATVTDLPDLLITISQAECLKAIEHERQTELFAEWGHRWLDLKRTGRADAVLSIEKGSNWASTDKLFPIPQIQLDRDPNMKGQQNAGY